MTLLETIPDLNDLSLMELLSLCPPAPNEHQWEILQSEKRFLLVSGGEQAGKSLTASKFLVRKAFEDDEDNLLYWLVAADYDRTRAEFDYIAEHFAALGFLAEVSKRVDPGRITLKDGTRIETKSAKDPRTLAMRAPHGIVACEASQLDLETFHRLSSRLGPRRGWLFMSGTLEGSLGWYPALITAWQGGYGEQQSFKLPTPTNTAVYPGGYDDPEILRMKRESSDDYFLERIMGEPVPPHGLVFASDFRPDVHIRNVEYEPGNKVYIWEDPGYGSDSAHAMEIAHIIDGQVRVFDEIYENGMILSDLISIAMSRSWWREEKHVVSDPHYKDQHHAHNSVSEIWYDLTGLTVWGDRVHILPGIERMKTFLKHDPTNVPRIVFNPRCKGILSEFGAGTSPFPQFEGQIRAYRWKTDRDGNVVGETPDDRYNHAIKAVTYGLVEAFGYVMKKDLASKVKVQRW